MRSLFKLIVVGLACVSVSVPRLLSAADGFLLAGSNAQSTVIGLENDPLAITLENDGLAQVKLGLANVGKEDAKLSVRVMLQDKRGVPRSVVAELVSDRQLPVGSTKSVVVTLKMPKADVDLPLTGILVWNAIGRDDVEVGQGVRRLQLMQPLVSRYLHEVIGFPLLFALAIVGMAWGLIHRHSTAAAKSDAGDSARISSEMGLPTWDFSRSWASNLTAVGAIFGTVLALTVTPDQTQLLARQTQVGLHLLFLGLIGTAPYIYNSVRSARVVDSSGTDSGVAYCGYVGMFLIACVITIWGVYGQTATLFLLLEEIRRARMWPNEVAAVFQGSLIVLMLTLIPYLVQSIYFGVQGQIMPPTEPREHGLGAPDLVGGPRARRELPKWSLL